MILINIKGIYCNLGVVELETNKVINWISFSNDPPPEIPFGSTVEVSVSFQENDFLDGKSGIVWATYDLRQAEIIQNTLVAQNINAEIEKILVSKTVLYLLKINSVTDINDASDFIWKSDTGLRLRPDWNYEEGQKNKSFQQWLGDH